MKYYYQMLKDKVDPFLPNQWVCCGGVNEESEKSKAFYLNHFSKFDTRFDSQGCKEPQNFKVIITDKFHGKVAGREEYRDEKYQTIPFNEDIDIVEKYNW